METIPHTYVFLDQEGRDVTRLLPRPLSSFDLIYPFAFIDDITDRVRLFPTLKEIPVSGGKVYTVWDADFELYPPEREQETDPKMLSPHRTVYYKEIRWADPPSKRVLEV